MKIELISRSTEGHFKTLIDAIKATADNPTIGLLKQEEASGNFITSWMEELNNENFDQVDVATIMSEVLAEKDSKEMVTASPFS